MGAGSVIEARATAQDEVGHSLPGETEARAEVVEIGGEGRAIAAVGVNFGSGVGDAIEDVAGIGIEVLLTVVALVAAAENVPAQARGNGQRLGGVIGILDKSSIVGIGFSGEDVLGEIGVIIVLGVGAIGITGQADEQGGVIAAPYGAGNRLIGRGDVEGVGACGSGGLADVEVTLHPLEAGRDLVLTVNFGDGGVGIAVLAGIHKVVVVGGAPDPLPYVGKDHEGELFEDLLCRQRGGKTELGNVGVAVSGVTLVFVMAGKGIAQIQDGGGIEGQVVGEENIAAVGSVLGIVEVPPAGKDVGGGED